MTEGMQITTLIRTCCMESIATTIDSVIVEIEEVLPFAEPKDDGITARLSEHVFDDFEREIISYQLPNAGNIDEAPTLVFDNGGSVIHYRGIQFSKIKGSPESNELDGYEVFAELAWTDKHSNDQAVYLLRPMRND